MNIYFSPISMLADFTLEASGADILINGVRYALIDLAATPTDQVMPDFIVAATADSVTVLLPYWGEPSEAVAFPAPIIDAPNGPVELPK